MLEHRRVFEINNIRKDGSNCEKSQRYQLKFAIRLFEIDCASYLRKVAVNSQINRKTVNFKNKLTDELIQSMEKSISR